jgi:predicted dehydrogenase
MSLGSPDRYPQPTRRLRLGIVGGGRGALVGQWHAAGFRLSNRWDLLAGALSSDPDVARASGRDWLLADDRVHTDFRHMAQVESKRDDGIEAVAICTPNNTHRVIAETFMNAGIDIICDKPIANTLEDCRSLIELQKSTGLVFAVTHPYTFHPMVRQARDMIADGAIGKIRQFQIEYVQDSATLPADPESKPMSWRRNPEIIGRASATGDIGTHALHMLEFVSGQRVARLRADFHVCGAAKPMEDTAFLQLILDNDAPGAMWITQAAPGNYCGLRFRVYGETGGLEWDQENPELLYYNKINAPRETIVRGHQSGVLPTVERMITLPRGHSESLTDAWANLYREIAIAVQARREGTPLPDDLLALPTVEDGTRGVQFIHAAADSHEAGGTWTDLPVEHS